MTIISDSHFLSSVEFLIPFEHSPPESVQVFSYEGEHCTWQVAWNGREFACRKVPCEWGLRREPVHEAIIKHFELRDRFQTDNLKKGNPT